LSNPAVFLDRDGTLIEERGHLAHPDDVVFYDGTIDALRLLASRFMLFIVTNQSGIAKGMLTWNQVRGVNAHVLDRLGRQGVEIADVYVCPHARTDGCDCIKPKPYFLEIAAREHDVDLRRSYTVGDHLHDVELARNVGAKGVFVLTGHGVEHADELDPGHIVVPGIVEAARAILEDSESRWAAARSVGLGRK
jgi:D-glycero-D-manno-heptose 1,7-bisphosphate phosphatase